MTRQSTTDKIVLNYIPSYRQYLEGYGYEVDPQKFEYDKRVVTLIAHEMTHEFDNDAIECPHCHSHDLKKYGLRTIVLNDIPGSDDLFFNLKVIFHRYKCNNEKCNKVFSKEIPFKTKNHRMTTRLEKYVKDLYTNQDYSQSKIAKETNLSRLIIRNII